MVRNHVFASADSPLTDEEDFERHLRRLAMLSPAEKRGYAKGLEARDKAFAERHEEADRHILEARAFREEAMADENWNHDQPL